MGHVLAPPVQEAVWKSQPGLSGTTSGCTTGPGRQQGGWIGPVQQAFPQQERACTRVNVSVLRIPPGLRTLLPLTAVATSDERMAFKGFETSSGEIPGFQTKSILAPICH